MSLRAELKGLGVQMAAVWLLLAVFCMTYVPAPPVTARGVQCPTAAIQTIRVTEKVKLVCGCIVTKTVVRAPREGEKGFKQCRCAEKRAADQQAQGKLTKEKPTLELAFLPLTPLRFDGGQVLSLWQEPPVRYVNYLSPPSPPATPPPDLA